MIRRQIGIAAPVGLVLLSVTSLVQAQQRDTSTVDSTRVGKLPEITVTRAPEPLQRVPYAVGVLDRDDLQRGQQTIGIDEALNNLPGVVVTNRYNFSLDQRISIRGFGGPPTTRPLGRRLRPPLQLRRSRPEDPARRHPADPARRPEPAHQHRLRRPR